MDIAVELGEEIGGTVDLDLADAADLDVGTALVAGEDEVAGEGEGGDAVAAAEEDGRRMTQTTVVERLAK